MTDTSELLAAVLHDLAELVERTEPGPAPTPCTEFDVSALRDHTLGWLTTFAAGFADPDGRAPRASIDGYHAPADPARAAAAVHDAAARLDTALGAGAAGRTLWLGDAGMPGDLALGMILWEYQVHGWDLAAATGRPWSPAGVAESLAFAPGMLGPDYQGEGKPFGPPVDVPADARALDRLLALSGRNPAWRPPA